jgi:hypothetical protein
LPSSEEILFEDERFVDLDSLLIDECDRTLLGNIKRVYESGGTKTFGVICGSRHMRSAADFSAKLELPSCQSRMGRGVRLIAMASNY